MSALIGQFGMQLLVAVVVPMLIEGMKKILPKLPKNLLPILAPVLGALADQVSAAAGGPSIGPMNGIVAGLAGVGVREALQKGNTTIKALV